MAATLLTLTSAFRAPCHLSLSSASRPCGFFLPECGGCSVRGNGCVVFHCGNTAQFIMTMIHALSHHISCTCSLQLRRRVGRLPTPECTYLHTSPRVLVVVGRVPACTRRCWGQASVAGTCQYTGDSSFSEVTNLCPHSRVHTGLSLPALSNVAHFHFVTS